MKPFSLSLLLCLAFFANCLKAQEFYRLKESIGMPLRSRSYLEVKGTPYFVNEWSKGIVKQYSGQSIKDINLKYDQVEDELIFKDQNGQELGFAAPVIEFKIDYVLDGVKKTSLFRSGFEPFKGSNEKNYYEVLLEGSVNLAKKNVKSIQLYREYNSATTTKSIISRTKYYFFITNKLTEFKRDTKSLQLAFGEKSSKILKYIEDNKLDLKNDDDLIKVFAYNSILK